MPNWRTVLIDWPARAFTAWWIGYRWLLTIMVMVVVTVTLIVLALELFGVPTGPRPSP